MKSLIALLCLGFLGQAQANIFAKIGSSPFDKNKRTHVVVAGKAGEAGMLFQQAAITKAYKYQEVNPESQVVVILEHENKLKDNVAWVEGKKLQIIKSSKSVLMSSMLIDTVKLMSSVASIDIYSHSGVSYGARLSDFSAFNTADKKALQEMARSFTSDAYLVIHGCNSGFEEAPLFSKILGIPVFGSLTSTDFQEKLTDGKWYFNNPEDKPAGMKVDPKCTNGLCIRMKPRNGAYNGHWGNYSGGGLPFYKAYCVNISEEKCDAALAKQVINFVSSKSLGKKPSLEDYKEVVQDMLCPLNASGTTRTECVAKLNEAYAAKEEANSPLREYSPFKAKQLQCSFETCEFKFVCPKKTFGTSLICDLKSTATKTPTTFVDEFIAYMDAYKTL
jgi:hypothetical protein